MNEPDDQVSPAEGFEILVTSMTTTTPGDRVERRLHDVLARWDRRLAEATATWHQLPAGERRRRDLDLDERGETDEWVLALWAWWEHSPSEEQVRLGDDVRFLASLLRAARGDGRLAGPGEEAAAGRNLLQALGRMERILGVDPFSPDDVLGPGWRRHRPAR